MRMITVLSSILFLVQSASALTPIKLAEDNRLVLDPALSLAVQSANPTDRKDAAVAYGRIMKKEGITPLLSLTQDSDTQVAAAALFAIGQLGWSSDFMGGQEASVISKLDALLPSLSPKLQALALDAIAKIGPTDSFSHFVPYLSNSNVLVRRSAALSAYRYSIAFRNRSAGAYPAFPEEIVRALLPLTSDVDAQVRENATLALSKMKSNLALGALEARLHDSQLWIRYYAIQGLGAIGDASAKTFLLAALQDSSYSVRYEAVLALQKVKAIADLPASLAHDPSLHVRAAYLTALASDAATPDLSFSAMLNDRSAMVRAIAVSTLVARKHDQELNDLVTQALSDSSSWVRIAATDFIKNLPDAQARLSGMLNDTDMNVRAEAANELSGITAAQTSLQDLMLNAPDPMVRDIAFSALSADQATAPALSVFVNSYLNSADEKWVEYRVELVNYFAGIPGTESTAALTEALRDPCLKIAYAAWKELKSRNISGLSLMDEPLPTRGSYADLSFSRNPKLVLQTSRGRIILELFAKAAPLHTARIVSFAELGGYAGTSWHRVVSDFVVQGGDPLTAHGLVPSDQLRAEINPIPFKRGVLGMPRSSEFDSGGLQLFITHVPTPSLDGLYTVFGRVVQGMNVIDQIEPGDSILSASVIR